MQSKQGSCIVLDTDLKQRVATVTLAIQITWHLARKESAKRLIQTTRRRCSCLKRLQRIAFFRIVQRGLYLLPLCLNRDFRGLSVGAAEGFLCQPPPSVQKLCIPPSVQPCWLSRFQRSEKREQKKLLLLNFLRFGERFPFPASLSCQAVGSRVYAEVPSQRYESICPSVKIIIAAKLILLHIWSDSRLCFTSSQFSGNVETFKMISGSSQLTNYVTLTCWGFKWGLILDWKLLLHWQHFSDFTRFIGIPLVSVHSMKYLMQTGW